MSQCSSCSNPCAEETVFCEECLARLENTSIFAHADTDISFGEDEVSPFEALPLSPEQGSHVEQSGQHLFGSGSEQSASDQTVARLDEAARWIEEEEAGGKRLRRSSRLAPLRDISAEIQRASTPHPRATPSSGFNSKSHAQAGAADSPDAEKKPEEQKLGKVWSWLHQENDEEKESDLWANATDPLLARSRPTAADSAQIEAEDIQRARLENHTTLPHPTLSRQTRRQFSLWRKTFGILIVAAVVILIVDGLLLSFAFKHGKSPLAASGGPPTLTLSENVASVGETMSLHLIHFAPLTNVVLTHDIQETLLTTASSSSLKTNANGEANASFVVNSSWGPGSHLVVAEDVATRDTASAILLISGQGPSRPPHLLLDSSSLDLGSAVQGADTIQPLVLHNSGSGSITWSVSSNKPWLLVAPLQGTFGAGQTISVAVQRNDLSPGDYAGTLTISSNVSAPEEVQVGMEVSALPPNAGPVISLSPPLLSFTTTDGTSTPQTQMLTLSNPGQQALQWSITPGNITTTTLQNTDALQLGTGSTTNNASWLHISPAFGNLASGQSVSITITVNTQSLLPGAYMSMLTFSSSQGTKAYDTPQMGGIALTVQPHCGLITSSGLLAFTAVAGQSNPSAHVLGLNATSSCSGATLARQALPSNSWITANPSSGQVQGTSSNFTSIGVNTAGLIPGTYTGVVTFQTGKDTQTVTVQLTLQPHPAPTVPILGALPLSINFNTIQGNENPVGQVITITNNGGSLLKWHTNVSILDSSWIVVSPTGGTVLPGQTGQVTVNVQTKGLTPGNYAAQITLLGYDANGAPVSGNPQTLAVNLTVQPPCALTQPSAISLLFNGIAGGTNPASQTVTFMGTGSCAWPQHWTTNIRPASPWLALTPNYGTLNTTSQQGSITAAVNTNGLQPGTYSAQVTINASDSTGEQVGNMAQNFTVTLTVLQPCTLQQLPSTLSFSASQGQSSVPSQTLSLSETGSCSGGVAWTTTADSPWLSLSATSGIDNGSGSSIGATVTTGNLIPGSYIGHITISASNNGVVLAGSPQTVTVAFVVTGYTVSGTALACSGPAPSCVTSQGLANATVSLVSNGTTIATVTADSAGNFSFINIPLGNYSLSVSGSSGGTPYSGVEPIIVNGNTSGVVAQTFPS